MALQARIVQSGLSAINAQAVQGTVANALTGTGTTQAGALALAADINRFTTVGANSGAILPAMNPGDSMEVINSTATALSLYPPVGGAINAVATNGAYSIAAATPFCKVRCVTPTQYIAMQSA
jgi:hypothetical protein